MKIPAIGDDSYTLYLETYKGLLYVHCDIHKWVKSTAKKVEVGLDYLLDSYKQPLYAPHDDTIKQRKFLDMCGFKYFGKVKDFDGDRRTVYVKRGKR